jgi:tRNA nucleotidyltransferase (CCA-adding enzyme)
MTGPRSFELFEVGGAVRDALLGEPVHDRDWVAVGATPEMLLALGYQPVGRDFPVFLHPESREEVALARTERKTSAGYRGFVVHADPSVTLEEDLGRRDLTINAMARAADGRLIDPHGGLADLRAGVLRHVSPAFEEDPVRLLRVARFAARWPHFHVAEQTQALLCAMVASGEVDALVPERVWQELSRGLMERQPSRMWQVLSDCAALARLLPDWPATAERLARLDAAAAAGLPLEGRYALALQSAQRSPEACTAAISHISQRWRVPGDCQALALLLAREGAALLPAPTPAAQLALFERCDAWRRPERMAVLLEAAALLNACDHEAWHRALAAALAVDTAAAAAAAMAQGLKGQAIGRALRQARERALERQFERELGRELDRAAAAAAPALSPGAPPPA